MQYICNFLSKRNIPLVLNHLPETHALLSIENWEEWNEHIYIIYPNGVVESINDDKFQCTKANELIKRYDKNKSNYFLRGCWNPDFINDLCKEIGIEMDGGSLDMIIGRWTRKVLETYV